MSNLTNDDRCRQLFCAVIRQAIVDATAPITGRSSFAVIQQHERDRARDWLLKPNKGFERVCSYAGLDPEYVRSGARKAIAEADANNGKSGRLLARSKVS